MRTLVFMAIVACMAWAAGEYVAVNSEVPPATQASSNNNPWGMELSHDNGSITSAWVYISGIGTYAGVEYNEIPYSFYALQAIKYYVWSQGWPDSAYQGFGVACWKMEGGMPGTVIWPEDGIPEYNPNTGGNWIIQCTDWVEVDSLAPEGFVVGIAFLYSYPANDAFGVDETGPGPYDWAQASGSWTAAPYGKGAARALYYGMPVEPTSLGLVRAFYH